MPANTLSVRADLAVGQQRAPTLLGRPHGRRESLVGLPPDTGALANLGHDLAHNTVRNILKRHGIEPAPERVRKTTWKEFLQRHWEQIVASDFFTIDVSKLSRLVSLVMFWFTKVSAHRLYIARTPRGTDEMSRIRGVGKEADIADMRALHERRRNRVVADGYVRPHCRYRTKPRVGELANRQILRLRRIRKR